jgi:hypothetical protein
MKPMVNHSQSMYLIHTFPFIHSDNLSVLKMADGLQSAEDEKTPATPSQISYKQDTSTPQFSPINTYRQQSTSATNDNDNLPLFIKTKKRSFRSMSDRKRKLYTQETDRQSLQSNSQGYFHKLMNCFRRTNIDRSRYENK